MLLTEVEVDETDQSSWSLNSTDQYTDQYNEEELELIRNHEMIISNDQEDSENSEDSEDSEDCNDSDDFEDSKDSEYSEDFDDDTMSRNLSKILTLLKVKTMMKEHVPVTNAVSKANTSTTCQDMKLRSMMQVHTNKEEHQRCISSTFFKKLFELLELFELR